MVQGESSLIANYQDLMENDNRDIIYLTFDQEVDNAIYFPDSTWSEGRNKLLEAAKEKDDYLYYIFCDDDIKFTKGNWDEFQNLLLEHKPAIGFPVVPVTRKKRISFLEFQLYDKPDQQMIAYHMDLISDNFILPYQEHLDEISWWGSGGVIQQIIPNFYKSSSIQFNTIQILNLKHNRYDIKNMKDRLTTCIKWFENESSNNMKISMDPQNYIVLRKIIILINTIKYFLSYKSQNSIYKIDKNKLQNLFKDDSVFIKQYNSINVR